MMNHPKKIIAGVMIASTALVLSQGKDGAPDKQASVLFTEILNDRMSEEHFVPGDPLADLCVKRIKLTINFNRKLETEFGDDAIHDFNFAMQGGQIYIKWWPDKIEPERLEVKPLKDGMFLFSYPNLGTWPVSRQHAWKISISDYLSQTHEEVEDYRRPLAREIFYYEKGISLMDSDPALTIGKLREEMEKAFKEFK